MTLRGGIAFAYYGLGALAFGLIVLPARRAWDRACAEQSPDLGAQRLIHAGTRSFAALLEWLRLVRVEWTGAERLQRTPLLVVANHPSLIDTPLLTCRMQQADFLVSATWSENPFLRHAVRSSGYLRADRGAKVVRDAVERLRGGRSVVIFPEGTRSPPNGLGPFHRGAAHIAIESGCDVVPVVIRVEPRVLMKGQFWADVTERRPVFRIEVGDPIRLADHLDGSESRPLAARRLTGVLQGYFEKRWMRGIG